MGMATRVFIADDHPFVVAGIRAEIGRLDTGLEVAGEAANAPEMFSLLGQSHPGDILVTDYAMRGPSRGACDGLTMLARVRRLYPDLRVIVLTDIANPTVLSTIVGAGVRGLVGKTSPRHELVSAIRKVASGRLHFCRTMRVALDGMGERYEAGARISPREAEVVRLFADGMTVSEIAARLSRSVKTISRQKNDAMHKLGLHNNAQLYVYARESGLTAPGSAPSGDAL